VRIYDLDVGQGETRSFNALLGWNDMRSGLWRGLKKYFFGKLAKAIADASGRWR